MSRTIRKYGNWLRSPRGRKQALRDLRLHGGRNKAIPPDGWDDIPTQYEAHYIFYKVAKKMYQDGLSREEIIRKLKKKFNLSERDARDSLPYELRYQDFLLGIERPY